MNILMTGASGLIGSALSKALSSEGHRIYPLRRIMEGAAEEEKYPFYWSWQEDKIHLDPSINIECVIHLAGENIASGRWTARKKRAILQSRVLGTRLLARSLASLKPKPHLFISASAIGYYGNSGETLVDESSPPGEDFLSHVSLQWEEATQPASKAGIRTVNVRTGIVLSQEGGVLKKVLPIFKLGLGGKVGNGNQYMSWVSMKDWIGMARYVMDHDDLFGPINFVSPQAVRNVEFTRILGNVLKRPTIFPLPTIAVKAFFGEMGEALLLSSSRVYPAILQVSGYPWHHEDLEKTFKELLA